ncbi:unnamed protein product [Lactuca virosa]|uniref:Uncharacterized protein n=1 Tax=Lactuca virosa TaxID=75947 RepID=A0AAU9P2T5_9ASTR|nr:unnamed protein product [Lactuca virosa]
MGVCDWFKMISRNKRKKKNTPIKLKIQHDSIDSKGAKNGYSMEKELGFLVSSREVKGLSMGTKELAAIRIQSAFRAYKARKMLRYLQGISRCKDKLTFRQASTALERLHFWSKIQAEINSRRMCMVKESRIKQLKLEDRLKVESKLHELEMKWCDGPKTMVETTFRRIQQREEASNKRERALAYAFSHQWRANSSRYFGQAYYDLSKENWGWKWTERWIAVYRLEAHVVVRPIVSLRTRQPKKPCERTKIEVGMKH